jgi:formate--tetrahydrofolate ligase
MEAIAADAGIPAASLEPYGRDVAKIDLSAIAAMAGEPRAKYIVVSAITPTPLGEGKTTTTVGLGQAFGHLGQRATIAIRQPSMGPTFGIKGGAAGGGYSQVVPMERMNLHLTGDIHAVTAAHNLCAAMVDAHLFHHNEPFLDADNITWRRVLDVNDRALRSVTIGEGGPSDGVPRRSGFDITAASEVMAALALCTSLDDLRSRLGRMVVGHADGGEAVTAEDIGAAGAMAVLLLDAIKPNLMQTIEGTPALVHTGPFGNIATGASSIVADLIGLRSGDYLLTEAGFGADMGAERFFNIKCRYSGLAPDAAVLVVTTRALKVHAGGYRIAPGKPLPEALLAPGPDQVAAGGANLLRHIAILRRHGVTPVVAVNVFPGDHDVDVRAIETIAAAAGVRCARATHFLDGGRGAVALAAAVADAAQEPSTFEMLYPDALPLREKIATIATEVYGAVGVDYSDVADSQLTAFEAAGLGSLPICVAKTHLSLSADPSLTGAPTGWRLPVREVRAAVGAGFVYPICGSIRTMPGLGAHPAAARIDIDTNGRIVGLS